MDDAQWERLKKAAYGSDVRMLNSFEHICIELAQAHFADSRFFDFPVLYDGLTCAEGTEFLRAYFRPERTALAQVRPKEERR